MVARCVPNDCPTRTSASPAPSVQFEQFSTEAYPVHQRQQRWREVLGQYQICPTLVREHPPLFGQLKSARTERGLGLARIASSPQTLAYLGSGAWAPGAVARSESAGAVWVSLHLDGQALLREPVRTAPLSPGDIVVGPPHLIEALEFHSDFRQFIVSLPERALAERMPARHRWPLCHLTSRSAMGRLLAGTLSGLSESFDSLGEHEIATVEQSLCELAAMSMGSQMTEGSQSISSTRAATLQRVCAHIEAHLADSQLCLASVAAHERVSERLIQKLFEDIGQSFSAFVRGRRLERCRSDLGSRLYGHLSIADIGFRWGFNDAAHFSHAFRDRFNISPRQYRNRSNEESQQSLRTRLQRGWPSGYFEPASVPLPLAEEAAGAADNLAGDEGVGARRALKTAARPVGVFPEQAGATGRHHHLPASAQTIHWGYFSSSIAPALTIDSGDIVTIETLTQHAYDDYERMIRGDSGAESVFAWTREHKAVDRRGAGPADASIYGRGAGEGFGVHICTGPIRVKGAEPGDVLEIRILDVAPRLAANARFEGRAFGSNAAAWWGFHYEDLIEAPKPREVITIYEVDCNGSQPCAHAVYNYRWTPQTDPCGVVHPTIDYPGVPVDRQSITENHGVLQGVSIPVRPHFGVIAVAPAANGLVDSVPPSSFGGNLDNWRIAEGATVYLRVAVQGGLLSVGDPHASQGDSEVCGTAIECSLTGVFQVILHKAGQLKDEPFADIDYPLVETAQEWVLHGFSHPDYLKEFGDAARSAVYEKSSLDSAMRDAFRKTRRFLMTAFGLTEDEAISLMSVAVDFGITQVVDGNWGVHAVIRKSLFAGRTRKPLTGS
jgi:acetamidase/formamidase/AraC-like DNA-binding protein